MGLTLADAGLAPAFALCEAFDAEPGHLRARGAFLPDVHASGAEREALLGIEPALHEWQQTTLDGAEQLVEQVSWGHVKGPGRWANLVGVGGAPHAEIRAGGRLHGGGGVGRAVRVRATARTARTAKEGGEGRERVRSDGLGYINMAGPGGV